MTLIRWNPSLLSPHRDLYRLHDEMDRLFDGFNGNPAARGLFAPGSFVRRYESLPFTADGLV